MTRLRTVAVPWAGLASGPTAWAVSTQLNYAITPWVCAHGWPAVPVLGGVLALLALAGGLISWQAREGRTRAGVFLASLSTAAAVLFAAVILTQGAAGLVFSGCEQ